MFWNTYPTRGSKNDRHPKRTRCTQIHKNLIEPMIFPFSGSVLLSYRLVGKHGWCHLSHLTHLINKIPLAGSNLACWSCGVRFPSESLVLLPVFHVVMLQWMSILASCRVETPSMRAQRAKNGRQPHIRADVITESKLFSFNVIRWTQWNCPIL